MQWSQTMGVLGKKSIKVKGVKEIAWSPSDNYLAYWVPEEGERPAKGQFVAFVLWHWLVLDLAALFLTHSVSDHHVDPGSHGAQSPQPLQRQGCKVFFGLFFQVWCHFDFF